MASRIQHIKHHSDLTHIIIRCNVSADLFNMCHFTYKLIIADNHTLNEKKNIINQGMEGNEEIICVRRSVYTRS